MGGGRWWKQKRNSRTKMAAPPGRPHQEPPGRPSGGPGGVLEESGGDPVRVSRNILGGIPGIREKHMGVPGAPRGCPGASQSRPGASAGQLRLGVGKVPGQDKTIDRDLIPRCAHADAQFCDSPRCAHPGNDSIRPRNRTTPPRANVCFATSKVSYISSKTSLPILRFRRRMARGRKISSAAVSHLRCTWRALRASLGFKDQELPRQLLPPSLPPRTPRGL